MTRSCIPPRIDEAMGLLARGLTDAEVAQRMGIESRSVAAHVYAYNRLTGRQGRQDAIRHYCQAHGIKPPQVDPVWAALTPRQRDVARFLVRGVWREGDIAQGLTVEVDSVRHYIWRMRRRTGAPSKRALVAMLCEGVRNGRSD